MTRPPLPVRGGRVPCRKASTCHARNVTTKRNIKRESGRRMQQVTPVSRVIRVRVKNCERHATLLLSLVASLNNRILKLRLEWSADDALQIHNWLWESCDENRKSGPTTMLGSSGRCTHDDSPTSVYEITTIRTSNQSLTFLAVRRLERSGTEFGNI